MSENIGAMRMDLNTRKSAANKKKALQIAVAGKGGVGKTTFSALMIRYLSEKKHVRSILAVDADANANLNEALGVESDTDTISEMIAKTKEPHGIPEGMSQDAFIQYQLHTLLNEGDKVDTLVMGGPDGPGCYCFPNNILKNYLSSLASNYEVIVMDNEAGLEHISRRTTDDIDILFVVSDSSVRSVRSAGRVNDLTKQIHTKIMQKYLVLTRTTDEDAKLLEKEIEKTGLTLIGTIPTDPLVTQFDIEAKPIFDLPGDAPSVQAAYAILDKVFA